MLVASRLARATIAAAALAACRPMPLPRPLPPSTPQAPASAPQPAPSTTEPPASAPTTHAGPLARHPAIVAEVRGPSSIPFAATSVGLNGAAVVVTLRNASDAPVSVAGLRVSFAVRRGAVPFRCEPHDDARAHEPIVLEPGQSFPFTRSMHCWTPVTGRYDVSALVALEGEPPQLAGSFAMDVVGDAAACPRELPGRPGLYAAMGSDPKTRPVALRDAERRGYHAVVMLANASERPVPIGPLRMTLLVRKKGSAIPCAGETVARALPAVLGPGEVRVVAVPVTCIRDEQGEYVVSAELAFDDTPGEPVEIGRTSVRVTSDPLVLWPIP